jgi:hypothetical protein
MALARVVAFEGVEKAHVDDLVNRIQESDRPDGLPATEMFLLYDEAGGRSLAVILFDNEDDYAQGDATLGAMDRGDTPGTRTGVSKYEVALHMKM